MRHYNWTKAAVLTTSEGVWFESGRGLISQLRDAKIEVLKPAAFEPTKFKAATLTEIKRSGIRIVTLLANDHDTLAVASSAAQEQTLIGWAWFIDAVDFPVQQMHGWLYFRPLLPSEGMQVFAEQVADYSNSHFFTTFGQCLDRNDTSRHGSTCAESLLFCLKRGINWESPAQTNKQACPVTCGTCSTRARGPLRADTVELTYSVALHEAIMLYAHAATKVLSEGGDIQNGLAMTAAVQSTVFEGVGGSMVHLDNHGDRIETYEVMNYVVGKDGEIDSMLVGMWDQLQQYTVSERAVQWPGNVTEVPVDHRGPANLRLACSLHA